MTRWLVIAVTVMALTACTADELAAWTRWFNSVDTCHEAVDVYWPAGSRSWAHRIVDRESGGDAGAQNPRSSAAGCFGIVRGTWLANAGGIPWSDRYNPKANVQVALAIYRRSGTGPWT